MQQPALIPARGGKQCDFAAPQTRASEGQFLAPELTVSAFDLGELLHEADGYVRRFCQSELLYAYSSARFGSSTREGGRLRSGGYLVGPPTTNANPWAAIEWQILPSDPQAFLLPLIEPALRLEVFCVLAVGLCVCAWCRDSSGQSGPS